MRNNKKNVLRAETTELINIYKEEFPDNEKIKFTWFSCSVSDELYQSFLGDFKEMKKNEFSDEN